jgi:hypothetical protein
MKASEGFRLQSASSFRKLKASESLKLKKA